MTGLVSQTPASIDILPPLVPEGQKKSAWVSRLISLALIIAIALQVDRIHPDAVAAAIPNGWAFWVAFAALYMAQPVADWLIFRGLWGLPLRGFAPIVRKRIANELLIDYSGEVYFYFWARRNTKLTSAPFGAIKDVNILSALASNLLTLGLLAVTYPFLTELAGGRFAEPAAWSAVITVGLSLGLFIFRRQLITLDLRACVRIFAIHLVRAIVATGLLGLVWHLALPEVPIGIWLALSCLKLVISRLPVVPSKELLFTTISIFMLGNDSAVSALLAMTAGLTLFIHVLLAGLLAITALFERKDDIMEKVT